VIIREVVQSQNKQL